MTNKTKAEELAREIFEAIDHIHPQYHAETAAKLIEQALSEQQGSGWLDIESVSKDVEVLVYATIHHSAEHKKNTGIETTRIISIARYLSISDGKGVWCGVLGGQPTHWMPLPAAPNAALDEKEAP
jgi:hypothetical protein